MNTKNLSLKQISGKNGPFVSKKGKDQIEFCERRRKGHIQEKGVKRKPKIVELDQKAA